MAEKVEDKKPEVDSTMVATWGFTENALQVLSNLIKESKSTQAHVLFECGTVVCVSDEDKEFDGFPSSSYKFPGHRVRNDEAQINEMVAGNQARWLKQKWNIDVRRAFQTLINDGYPFPGGNWSDRVLTPLSPSSIFTGSWKCTWPNRSPKIYNIAINMEKPREADAFAADMRRYDHMSPSAYAVVRDEEITYIRAKKGLGAVKAKFEAPTEKAYPFLSASLNPIDAIRGAFGL